MREAGAAEPRRCVSLQGPPLFRGPEQRARWLGHTANIAWLALTVLGLATWQLPRED